MSRLIVVSNRVSAPTDPGQGSAGGLAMALSAALREYRGVWFGWSGQTTEHFSGQLSMQKRSGVTVALMDLEEQDIDEYYNGYANKTLWPLFHYRMDLAAYERSFGEGYQRVNQRFAETLLPLIEPDDFIWVQDYHLIPLASELRQRGVKNRIGFFLHIPWPVRGVFTTLPRHEQLVRTLFDYDLVGFQTADSRDAFIDYVTHDAHGSDHGGGVVSAWGSRTCAGAFPIGIDAQDFAEAVASDTARVTFERVERSKAGRKMILGVDRLDYSKGLEERFSAYEQFMVDHPDLQEQSFFLQIATPSRDDVQAYQEIRARLETVTGRINGLFSSIDAVPIRYVNQAHRRDELAGVYRAAELALVTPLRDGMNLVAKEYVAAQDPENPGVLVLSRFAGAADQMTEALIVNPVDRQEVADAIHRGLLMPLDERVERWRALVDGVRTDDVLAWREAFVTALKGAERHAPAEAA